MIRSAGALLLGLSAALAAFAWFVARTGGIDTSLAGIPLRSRSWERPAILAAVVGVTAIVLLRRQIAAAVRRIPEAIPAIVRGLPRAAALWAGAAAIVFGTFAAGGADSYGYVSQAELFARGRITARIDLFDGPTWPDVPRTLTPLAHTRGRTRDTLAPAYPPGLPLLMAPLAAIHARAVFFVVPFFAVAVVLLCAALGRELGDPLSGALASLLVAVSPTFLYQAVQPMSDVPVTACWLGALLLAARAASDRGAAAAGVVASIAILIRPNLAPLAVFVVWAAGAAADRRDWRRAVACAAAMIPVVLLLGVIQQIRYGSPLASGYGPFGDLFSAGNVLPNLARYPRWLTETHSPFIWVWLLAPFWIVRAQPRQRRLGWLAYAFSGAVIAAYLPYVYFQPEEWFYTRFLLPAVPVMLLFAVLVTRSIARRVMGRAADGALLVAMLALAAWYATGAVAVGAFQLRDAERKYPLVGAFVRERLPAGAFVLAMQHSGSIQYYSGRQTLRWDLLDRAWLDRAVLQLRASGREPFAALDRDEEIEFRRRFAAAAPLALDRMVPLARIGPTTIYAFR